MINKILYMPRNYPDFEVWSTLFVIEINRQSDK